MKKNNDRRPTVVTPVTATIVATVRAAHKSTDFAPDDAALATTHVAPVRPANAATHVAAFAAADVTPVDATHVATK